MKSITKSLDPPLPIAAPPTDTCAGPALPYYVCSVRKGEVGLPLRAVRQLWPESTHMEVKQSTRVSVHTGAASQERHTRVNGAAAGAEVFELNLVSYSSTPSGRRWRLSAATALFRALGPREDATVFLWRDGAGRVVAAAQRPVPVQQQGGQQGQRQALRLHHGEGEEKVEAQEEKMEDAALWGDDNCTPAATPSSAALLPASSLTPAHLYGYAGPAAVPPPLQPGELRACGSTFHPELAPGVRAGLQQWAAEHLGGEQHAGGVGCVAAALAEQVWVLGEGPAGWGAGAAAAEGELPWLGVLRQHGVSRNILAAMLSERLGLQEDRHDPLPGCLNGLPRELPDTGHLEPCADPRRGGVGLRATAPIRKSHPVEVLAGYVMPGRVAKRFGLSGHRDAGAGVAAAVEARAGDRRWAPHAWQLLVGAYSVPYHEAAREASAGMHDGGGEGQGSTGVFLQMLFAAWVEVLYICQASCTLSL